MFAIPRDCFGGITRLEDLRAVQSLGAKIEGAIVGKALYDGKLDYQAALTALGSHSSAGRHAD